MRMRHKTKSRYSYRAVVTTDTGDELARAVGRTPREALALVGMEPSVLWSMNADTIRNGGKAACVSTQGKFVELERLS